MAQEALHHLQVC